MKPRSHSLNQVVWVTMTAIEAAPTIKRADEGDDLKGPSASDIDRSRSDIRVIERLADAEVDAPVPLLGSPLTRRFVDRIQLVAEVDARRADRRQVAEARARRRSAGRRDRSPTARDQTLPKSTNATAPNLPAQRQAHFGRPFEHRVAADRQAESAERADLEAPPAADARRAAEEEALVERHVALEVAERIDGADAQAVRDDHASAERQVVARLRPSTDQ